MTELDQLSFNQWQFIFEMLAPALAEAIANPGKHVTCPVHGGKDGFRLFKDFNSNGAGICNSCGAKKGLSMLVWVNNSDYKTQARDVAKLLKSGEFEKKEFKPKPVVLQTSSDPVSLGYYKTRIQQTLAQSKQIQFGDLADLYLKKRGIILCNTNINLLFNSNMRYFNFDDLSQKIYHPAIIAPITNLKGDVGSCHRIYLSKDGTKADVKNPKQMMTKCVESLNGYSIKLFDLDATDVVLCLAEGIETALAVHNLTNLPVWATITAGLMETIEIPKQIKKVVVFADLDVNSKRGQQAAETLKNRLEKEGVCVEIYFPPIYLLKQGEKGIDWLDVISRHSKLNDLIYSFKNLADVEYSDDGVGIENAGLTE
jgi:putative DNA primase/helicase